jgi:hypothetical protein
MMKLLFLFMDGVGLGKDDPQINPFARARMPALEALLEGRRLLADAAPFEGRRASLLALDACLGVSGLPQSATGQATLLTGRNVPRELGYHYGPKPNPQVASLVSNGNLFARLKAAGRCTAFLNAYPPGYFAAIESGRRIYAAIALAATRAGLMLRDMDDLRRGEAIAADFTGLGLRQRLGLKDAPLISPRAAGERLARLALGCDFSLFEYWPSDYAGHGQDMDAACELLETFDQVLEGLLTNWDDEAGLILITSDHGNLEDLSTRRHTENPSPALVIGNRLARRRFTAGLKDLTHIAPAILQTVAGDGRLPA